MEEAMKALAMMTMTVAVCAACGGVESKTAEAGAGSGASAAAAPAAWKKLEPLGLQMEVPSDSEALDASSDTPAVWLSGKACSARVTQTSPAFARDLAAAKAEIEKDPGCPFKAWGRAEKTADGWHLEWQCADAFDKAKVNHGVQLRRTFGARQVDCWEKVDNPATAACAVRACQSLKPL
jgi:hypothetical protein